MTDDVIQCFAHQLQRIRRHDSSHAAHKVLSRARQKTQNARQENQQRKQRKQKIVGEFGGPSKDFVVDRFAPDPACQFTKRLVFGLLAARHRPSSFEVSRCAVEHANSERRTANIDNQLAARFNKSSTSREQIMERDENIPAHEKRRLHVYADDEDVLVKVLGIPEADYECVLVNGSWPEK